MGRKISTYTVDSVVAGNDKWIGSDADQGNATMNFTPDDLALYYIINGYVDPSRNGILYTYRNPNVMGKGVLSTSTNDITLTNLPLGSTTTQIYVSAKDANGIDQSGLWTYLIGHDLKVTVPKVNSTEPDNVIYTLNSFSTEAVTRTNGLGQEEVNTYFRLDLTHQIGSVDVTEGSVVSFSSISGTGSGSSGIPNMILTGADAPDDDNDGRDGDIYVQIDGAEVTWYGPKANGAWGDGISLNGTDGTNGVHGTSVSAVVDVNGFITITTTTYDEDNNPTIVVGTPVDLKGPTGGEGADGRTLLNGNGIPSNSIGEAGDFYIDTTNDDIYGPKTTVWGAATSLVGPQGNTGPKGDKGADGEPGAQGLYDVEVYQVLSQTADRPDTPVGGFVQNGVVSSPPLGWVNILPDYDPDTETIWESRAQINPEAYTEGDPITSWSTPFTAGSQGPTGPQGPGYSGAAVDSNGNLTIIGTGGNTDVGPVNVRGPQGNTGENLKVDGYTIVTGANPGTTVNLETAITEVAAGSFFVEKGDTGETGKAGTQIYVSNTIPTNGMHELGDYVLVTDDFGIITLYGPQETNGTYGVHRLTGAQGTIGPKGDDGEAVTSVRTVTAGTSTTATEIGFDTDEGPISGTVLIQPGPQGPGYDNVINEGTDENGTTITFVGTGVDSEEILIPRGPKGDSGNSVSAVRTVTAGTTTTPTEIGFDTVDGPITGTVFIQPGPKGDTGGTGGTGAAAALDGDGIGSVTTGNPGTNAEVSINGTAQSLEFDFVIPRGDKGETGTGIQGAQGFFNILVYSTASLASGSNPDQITISNTAGIPNDTVSGSVPTSTIGSGVGEIQTQWTAAPQSATLPSVVLISAAVYDPANPTATITWSEPYVASGTAGPQGPQGPKGDKGDDGVGSQGEQGVQGLYTVFVYGIAATNSDPQVIRPQGGQGISQANRPTGTGVTNGAGVSGWSFAALNQENVGDGESIWLATGLYNPATPTAAIPFGLPFIATGTEGSIGPQGPAGTIYTFPNTGKCTWKW